jgi:Ca2+-binding EF-hand superfamily protein
MSWEKGMLDNAAGRTCKDARPTAVLPTKQPALTPQQSSTRNATTTPAISHPSPMAKKQLKSGSRPMTIEESYDEVEKMLEEHMRQRREPRPRRIEAFDSVSEQAPLQRHTFVFAPLNDPRMLSEMAAQEAADAREGVSRAESDMENDREGGGTSVRLKYFGPEARASYYRAYRELHSKPHLFVHRDVHDHPLGSLRANSSATCLRRSTGLRRSLPSLEQAQIPVGGGDMNLPRSPRMLFLGACLAGGQPAPTLLLRKEHNKRTFDFSHQGLGDNFIVRFAACLPELPLVECINVCDNRLTDAGISALLRALENKPHLTSLDVSSNPMGLDAASVLRGYIRSTLCTLRALSLNEVALSDSECARLAKALENNKSIERLFLRGNQVGLQLLANGSPTGDGDDEDDDDKSRKASTGGQAVGAMLTANLTLQQLDLSWNQLRAVGNAFIAAALPMNYQLRELDLSYNSLGNKGALSLAHALRSGARLRRLTLSYNGIAPRGAVGLASGLAANTSLSMLILDGNPLGTTGGKALMHASCAPRPSSGAASAVCQLSLLDCSLNVAAPTMSAATGDEQLHVFNPVDPAGSYVLDLSDAYEHMVAHELLRLAVSHPGRYHFTRLEYLPSTQSRAQTVKLEMVKRRVQPSTSPPVEEAAGDNSSASAGVTKSLNPVALLFQRIDQDGSGSVEFEELARALRSCGVDIKDERLAELLQKYDYDRSGSLHKREFANLFARVGFAFIDTDSSGSLDVDELRRVFHLLGVTADSEVNDAIARMIAKYDLDDSGEIDLPEFLEFMTSEVFTVQDDSQAAKDSVEAKSMRLEPCDVGSGAVWQIPNTGQLTADLVHSSGSTDVADTPDNRQQQTSSNGDGTTGGMHRPSDSVLMPDVMLARFLANASSISRNITEQTEFLHTVLTESGMYLSASQGEQLLSRQGVASSAVRPGRRLSALARLLPRVIDHREAANLVTCIVDIHNQWLERLALRRWLGTQLFSVLLGSLTNAYSFDLTRDDHRVALHRLALIAQEEKQFSRWRSGRADTSQSGNWENFRWATLDGEQVLLSSSYILNTLLGTARERTSLLAPPSKLAFYYVSTTRPPRGTKCLSQRRFEQLVAVLAQPPSDSDIAALCEDIHDPDHSSADTKRLQALLHWEILRRGVRDQDAQQQTRHRRRSVAGDTMNRLTTTVEGLRQKLVLLEVLVADRWLSCGQAQELVAAFPNAVKARAKAACLTFSRIVDLENFIQVR